MPIAVNDLSNDLFLDYRYLNRNTNDRGGVWLNISACSANSKRNQQSGADDQSQSKNFASAVGEWELLVEYSRYQRGQNFGALGQIPLGARRPSRC